MDFFHSEGDFPFSKHDWKIIPCGLQTDSSQIFNIFIFFYLKIVGAIEYKVFMIRYKTLTISRVVVDFLLLLLSVKKEKDDRDIVFEGLEAEI